MEHFMPQNLDCPICKLEAVYVFTSKLGKRIFKCKNIQCGHLFTPSLDKDQGICERPKDIEIESDEFIEIYGERNHRLLNLFTSIFKGKVKNRNFLDFGAGNAHISRTFKDKLKDKVKIYCVEANELCNNLYMKYGLIRLNSSDEAKEKIDLIYLIEVVEHLENPIEVLKSLKELLSDDGMIFISTPAGSKYECLTNAFETPSHIHFFTPKSLNLALAKAGLLKIKYHFYEEMYPKSNNHFIAPFLQKIKFFLKTVAYNIGAPNLYNGHLVGFTRNSDSLN